jgi:hypothetical protein
MTTTTMSSMSVKPRVRRILRLVRRPILILSLVIAGSSCRCNKTVAPAGFPSMPSAPTAPVAAPPPTAGAPEATQAPSGPAPEDERNQPPTAAEIRVQLTPLLPAIKSCVRSAGPFDMALALELHIRVEPAGEISDAVIVPLDSAHDCVKSAVSSLRLPMWRGSAELINIPMNSRGEPVVFQPPQPGDGG